MTGVWFIALATILAIIMVALESIRLEDNAGTRIGLATNAFINICAIVLTVGGSFIYIVVLCFAHTGSKDPAKTVGEIWGAYIPYPVFFIIGYFLFIMGGQYLVAKLNTRRLIRGRNFARNFKKTDTNPFGVGYEYPSRDLTDKSEAVTFIEYARGAGWMYAESWPYMYRSYVRDAMGIVKEVKPSRTEKLADALIKEDVK